MTAAIYLTADVFVFAQTSSPSAKLSPSETPGQNSAIENLKEKVANKVEELRKKNNRAIAGFVLKISKTSIQIKTPANDDYEVKLDETLTKYYKVLGTTQEESKLSDIGKGDYIIVTGVITDKIINANSVFTDEAYLVESGKITQVDKDNYILKVITTDKTIYSLSIETTTKQQIINIKTLEAEGTGFSKIKEGDSVHFTAKIKGTEKNNEYQAGKILIIPQEYFIK